MDLSRVIFLLSALSAACFSLPARAQMLDRPLVVEAFTAQGCPTCPGLTPLLGTLSGEGALVLSWHVNYWDYAGWVDPFSIPAALERQRAYSARFVQPAEVPQVVIDGVQLADPTRPEETLTLFRQVNQYAKERLPVTLSRNLYGPVEVFVGDGEAKEPADVWAVGFNSETLTDIAGGEHADTQALGVNVVNSFHKVGSWVGHRLMIALLPAEIGSGDGLALLVQEKQSGKILGAAAMNLKTGESLPPVAKPLPPEVIEKMIAPKTPDPDPAADDFGLPKCFLYPNACR